MANIFVLHVLHGNLLRKFNAKVNLLFILIRPLMMSSSSPLLLLMMLKRSIKSGKGKVNFRLIINRRKEGDEREREREKKASSEAINHA